MLEKKGLARASEIYKDPSSRAKELKAEGKKIIGYTCIYAPIEMMSALGLVPYRILGDMGEPITEADKALPPVSCPFMRSCLDLAFKGRYDLLDGVVLVHSCDPQEKTARIWETYVEHPYVHFIDIPVNIYEPSLEYFKGQLNDFKNTLECFVGEKLTAKKLKRAIELHNRQRALVRELYELRKPEPPLISGTETLQVTNALTRIPVEEGNELLVQVISEVKGRKSGPQRKAARHLIISSTLENVDMMAIFEDGGNVVMDDFCGGSRARGPDVKLTGNLIDGLAHRYLVGLTLPRTYREAMPGDVRKDYIADLESRFGYLKDFVTEWNVTGVILLLVRFCDPFAYEVPGLKDYFDSFGVPSIYIEHDYTRGAGAPLATRVEAFLEVIS